MVNFHNFRDWWRLHSDEIFEEARANDNWYEAFERCWEAARYLELQRCSELSSHRLSMEAKLDLAMHSGVGKDYLEKSIELDNLLDSKNKEAV